MHEYLKQSLKTGHVICISEGSAEEAIIKKLFDNDKLIFKSDDLYGEDKLIRSFSRTRKGRNFARENLQMDYGEQHVNIVRILDSKNEKFNLGKEYEERIESGEIRIFNILTRPEIEILIIINEGHYSNFTNKSKGIDANNYCKVELNMKEVKRKSFVSNYFYNVEILINSIQDYKKLHSKKSELSLCDLLE